MKLVQPLSLNTEEQEDKKEEKIKYLHTLSGFVPVLEAA